MNKKEYNNPIFEMYRCNVLNMEIYKEDLNRYKIFEKEYEVKAMLGKIRSLTKIIDTYEKVYKFRKHMVLSKI